MARPGAEGFQFIKKAIACAPGQEETRRIQKAKFTFSFPVGLDTPGGGEPAITETTYARKKAAWP